MHTRKPDWLKIKIDGASKLNVVKDIVRRLSLHTVCEEANCPNMMECFGKKTATFMILGSICTRNCTFCNVSKGQGQPVDLDEPLRVAQAVKELKLKHVVITSVTRDDLPDGGAVHFARTIKEIKKIDQNVVIEVLIPDFQGNYEALAAVIGAEPRIINHNVETVPRLYSSLRPMASYQRSLDILKRIKEMDRSVLTKSGLMLGCGEKYQEVIHVLEDLKKAGCELVTLGQYLAPSKKHHPVIEYVPPEIFTQYKRIGLKMGFKHVAASPLVRSSYNAEEVMTF